MREPEIYWKIISCLFIFFMFAVTGYCFYRFAKPFMQKKKYAWCVGITYFGVMMILFFLSAVINNFAAYGIGVLAAFLVMCMLDYRNIGQKIYLAVTFFLLRWISVGLAGSIYNLALDLVTHIPVLMAADLKWQFVVYVAITIFNGGVNFLFIWGAVRLILKAYICKRENMTWKELLMFLFPSLSIMAGYCGFQFCEMVYEAVAGQNLNDAYRVYGGLKNAYQGISFAAILVMIIMFQNIKSRQREEQLNELLSGQVEDMKNHIGEVEKLYRNIRGLKHDMANHIMTLEHLCLEKEQEAAVSYVARLKEQLNEAAGEMKSGNPVTDVILTEKRKEAEERQIAFQCEFRYPEGTDINAFDVSVILNNGLSNAIEGACKSEVPYIRISSYRRKNAYMIEIENSFLGRLDIDSESGLPMTTKESRQGHGFGLANIQKVAQNYYGDIDIKQNEESFILSIMLMLK